MRVSNKAIFVGEESRSDKMMQVSKSASEKTSSNKKTSSKSGKKSFFVGKLNENSDPIARKKKEAQEKAMKVVSDAFANDHKIDMDIENRRANIETQRSRILEAKQGLAELEKQKEELADKFSGIEDYENTQEYKDSLETIGKSAEALYEEIVDAEKMIRSEVAVIKGVKAERLKVHPMLDAKEQADSILDAASDEIMGMLIEEGKEHLEEEMKEAQEKAEKQAEEKEEQEEQIEAVKEKVEEMREFVEGVKKEYTDDKQTEETESAIYEMTSISQQKTSIQQEVENIVDKMKLVVEDIKGACVDKEV